MLKPFNEPVRLVAGQVEALRNLPASERNNPGRQERQEIAIECTAILLGGFRKCDADDPEIYSRSIEHVLARYDVDIQRAVTLPGQWKFPPSAFELREACEKIANEKARAKEREERIAAQLEERRLLDAAQAGRKPLLTYKPRDSPGHVTRAEQERRQAEAFLARCKAEASARPPPTPTVFELDPEG
jgi:hypothetical protein